MTLTFRPVDSVPVPAASDGLVAPRPCPVCNQQAGEPVTALHDFQFFSDDAKTRKRVLVQISVCRACDTTYTDPRYTADGFALLFAEAGQSYGSSEGRPHEQVGWLTERGLLPDGAAVLDVGCYMGRFLSLLPKTTERLGVDIDPLLIDKARAESPDIHFIAADFEKLTLDRRVDLITMFHVLEHVGEPVAVLRQLRALSHDGTRLVVEIPILENGRTNDLHGVFSMQHLTHFSRDSALRCFARAGWKLLEMQDCDGYNGTRFIAAPDSERAVTTRDAQARTILVDALSWMAESATQVERRVATVPQEGDLVVWGAGLHTELLYHRTSLFAGGTNRRFALIDSDKLKQGKTWRGIPIHAAEALADVDWTRTTLVISSYGGQESIAEAARARGVPGERIVKLYAQIQAY
ncbi:class I SAM-dependent methyltransferase [Roseiterribacter gracilis]|uniref:Methyltransferase domain-containing protein n=1 Tax=Roseiterribacter gracilis TaxID=2812848 RepID=A0A8S8XHR7_9PROT|nr:hypothetical protein TMPK1_37060 [Rhodospirillales bacterium TMPK1]